LRKTLKSQYVNFLKTSSLWDAVRGKGVTVAFIYLDRSGREYITFKVTPEEYE